MKKMKRYFVLPLLLVFAMAFCMQYYAGNLIGILKDDEILLALILILIGAVCSGIKLIRLWLCKRKEMDMPVASRREKVIFVSVLAALLLAEIVLIAVRQGQSWQKLTEEADIEFVSLKDIEGDGFEEAASARFDNSVSFQTSWAVPKQYDIRMAGQDAEGLPVTMQVCLYEVAFEGLAAPMLEAIMEARMDWNQILMQWEIDVEVDEAYAAGYMGFQYLFLRDGKRIVTVYYYGEQDLNENMDLFVNMLRQ